MKKLSTIALIKRRKTITDKYWSNKYFMFYKLNGLKKIDLLVFAKSGKWKIIILISKELHNIKKP